MHMSILILKFMFWEFILSLHYHSIHRCKPDHHTGCPRSLLPLFIASLYLEWPEALTRQLTHLSWLETSPTQPPAASEPGINSLMGIQISQSVSLRQPDLPSPCTFTNPETEPVRGLAGPQSGHYLRWTCCVWVCEYISVKDPKEHVCP